MNKSQLNRKKKINKEEMVVPKYMIRFLNPKKFYWDMFVIFLAVWNCITIPIDIAFSSDIFTSAGFILLDICIDLLFLLDIVVNFRTTFYDKDGDEIFDAKIIAKNYALGGRFTIDALATIPFDYMGGSVALKIFGLLKLARITRISKIISNLKMRDDLKAMVKVL